MEQEPATSFITPEPIHYPSELQMQQPAPVPVPVPEPAKPKRRIFKFGRKGDCEETCFMRRREELIKRYNLTENKLAQKYIGKRKSWRHKCTPHLTNVPRYRIFKRLMGIRGLYNSDAKQIAQALANYEKTIKQ